MSFSNPRLDRTQQGSDIDLFQTDRLLTNPVQLSDHIDFLSPNAGGGVFTFAEQAGFLHAEALSSDQVARADADGHGVGDAGLQN